jgi:glycosyltransferase involved in cell wall biosynthesis
MLLSAVIITYNEERNIQRCIDSLKEVADEIVVVDSFSTDGTKEICLRAGVRFLEHIFEGHIEQKNFAIDAARFDWIISLDADEALSEELKKSILAVKQSPSKNGYAMNRLTNYCGKWVRHCGWYPDTKVRLVDRKFAQWQGVNPHDRLELSPGHEVGFLVGDILHYSYYTKEDHFRQIEYFGTIAAKELHKKGGKSGWFLIVVKVLAQFIKSLVLKRGFMDGKTGWLISWRSAYATYVKYVKLLILNRSHASGTDHHI